MKKDIITLKYFDRCPYEVGQGVKGPISDSRRGHIGFPGIGKIISVEKTVSKTDGETIYWAKLEVTLPD